MHSLYKKQKHQFIVLRYNYKLTTWLQPPTRSKPLTPCPSQEKKIPTSDLTMRVQLILLCVLFLSAYSTSVHTRANSNIRRVSNAIAGLKESIRQSVPFAKSDISCWCQKSVKYTNEARRSHGVSSLLDIGTEKQLENANNFAEKLVRRGRLEHQDITYQCEQRNRMRSNSRWRECSRDWRKR